MILNPFSISGQAGLEAVCHLWIFTTVWPSSIPSESNGNLPNVSTAKNTTNSQHKLRLVATSWRGHATNCLPILREWVESGCMTKLRGVIDHSSATTFYCLYIPCSFLFVCIFFFLSAFMIFFCLYDYSSSYSVFIIIFRLLMFSSFFFVFSRTRRPCPPKKNLFEMFTCIYGSFPYHRPP